MQAGLVSAPLNWSDIFAAPGLSLRIFVAVVRIPVTVQLMETGTAELSTFSWPREHRTQIGGLINSEWSEHTPSRSRASGRAA